MMSRFDRTGQAAGFTLIELVVVLVIAGLLLALAPPLVSKAFPAVELRDAARRVAAGLRVARSRAVSRSEEAVWALDLQRRRFTVTGRDRTYSLPEKLTISLFTAQSELHGEGSGAIRFYPDGSSTGGRVTLARGERSYLVDVDWLTGRVSILE
jgi:general secretion pathway protein H